MPAPAVLSPMLATSGTLPEGEGWAYEYKWDGIRVLVTITAGKASFTTRGGLDASSWFPELAPLGKAVRRDCVLDGEVVSLGDNGRPDFGRIQERLSPASPGVMASCPVELYLFDVLRLDGEDLTRRTYEERRRALDSLKLKGRGWTTPPMQVGRGRDVLEVSRKAELEGVVAKRLDSVYRPGERSSSWIKVQNKRRREVVVGGWTEGEGGRRGSLGALLVGHYGSPEGPERLVYLGRVGTGFKDAMLDTLKQTLTPTEVKASPFDASESDEGGVVHYVTPRFVADVEFKGLTRDGHLRHPSFKGLRPDKLAKDVGLEAP